MLENTIVCYNILFISLIIIYSDYCYALLHKLDNQIIIVFHFILKIYKHFLIFLKLSDVDIFVSPLGIILMPLNCIVILTFVLL